MTGLDELLRITPRCQASRCRRNGDIHLTITNPKWQKAQYADLCAKHAPVIGKAAEAQGCTVKF